MGPEQCREDGCQMGEPAGLKQCWDGGCQVGEPGGMQHSLDAPAGPAPLPPPDGPVHTDGHEDDGEQERAEDAAQQHCGGKRKNIN